MHAIGNGIDRIAGEQFSRDFLMPLRNTIDILAQVQTEQRHVQPLLAAQHLGHFERHVLTYHTAHEVIRELVMSRRHQRMRGKDALASHAVEIPLRGSRIASLTQEFQGEQTGVPFIHVEALNLGVAEGAEHAYPADAENKFLSEAVAFIATIEGPSQLPVASGLRFRDVPARPTELLDLTSVTLAEFEQLVPAFESAFHTRMATTRFDGNPRTARRFSVYRVRPLPAPEDRLLFVLVYLKTYALQVVHGRLFGLGQSKANQWLHVLLPVLQTALTTLGDTPCRTLAALAQRLGVSAETVAAWGPLPEPAPSPPAAAPVLRSPPFAHDGTERWIGRPQAAAEQPRWYSGKKKCHTVKNLLLVNAPLTILVLSESTEGRVHDKRLADTTPYPLPAGSQLLQDLGFLAFTLPAVAILMPTKKPRGLELTPEQKAANRAVARRRVRIEHVNSSVKRYRIVKDTLRLRKAGLRGLVMELCRAPHNFRLRLSLWLPMT